MDSQEPAKPADMLRPLTERIRSDVLIGTFRPGEWLRQIDLQETYGTTRAQIRRSLDDLVLMGMAEHVPNRGIRLVAPSTEARSQISEIRTILEREAALMMVKDVRSGDMGKIAEAAAAFEKAVEIGSYAELRRLNHEFHRVLNGCLVNTMMATLLNDLRERNLPGSWSGWVSATTLKASSDDHVEMVEALRKRDGPRLADIFTRHINRWRTSRHLHPDYSD
ncbi:DNA-binding GntR family transcriptional regulator [Neorhizobium sp. 2083]|uniref:GntR family transcriptional regulator n=1 Tax=Neorhizobium sp. 2083 TaxID=2817762 RepID=UPI002864D4A1|nr:GntR family transcriptional regulator [Neorhizobium sp. 2083]MDR6817547.1 DNA-binding GntR family transcriptional regulator [Neorhizobium sp. 2083]